MKLIYKEFPSIAECVLFLLQNSSLKQRQFQQIHAQIVTNNHIHTHSTLLWNLLIRTSVESCFKHEFLSIYRSMQRQSVSSDKTTFTMLLRASSASAGGVTLGEVLHCQIIKVGFGYDLFLQTGLLDFYAKVGALDCAKQLFEEMPERDIVANNAMVSALGKHRNSLSDARKLFDEMPERNSSSWNTMITVYCKLGDVQSARLIFDSNPIKDVVSWNAIIDGYCKSGELMEARKLFDRMGQAKNSVTWNTMISGFVQYKEFSEAISTFQLMQAVKMKPTEVTMVSLLSACAHLGALDMGKWLHAYIERQNFKVDVVLGNALVDMYCKCGNLEAALDVFHKLPMKNVFCWNSIIVGLGMHGYGKEAIDAFKEMEKNRMKPDGVTFVGLLSACSHSGLFFEGKQYFHEMVGAYGTEPRIEHYGCMVDLLGRGGFLEEALELIRAMPMAPNIVIWGSLLRACQIHKDAKMSNQVMEHLLRLDPRDGANYVFLSNIYASLNRWDDVETCRKLMTEKGVNKMPGCSLIEVDNNVHEFIAGDTSHPQFTQINAFLDEIANKLRLLGHETDVDSVLHDIDEEEKESAVRYHSERIAVAFGLMSTPQGKPIRVVKNLRACNDCHVAIKLISKLFNREITVRDRSRFHHFKGGLCSCKDYW